MTLSMIKKNKRGISDFLVVFLIGLIALLAVILMWAVIKTMIVSEGEKISVNLVSLNIKPDSVIVGENLMMLELKRDQGDGEMVGVKVSINKGEQVYEEYGIDLEEFESSSLFVPLESGVEPKEISVAPIYEFKGGERLGQESIVYHIKKNNNVFQKIALKQEWNFEEDGLTNLEKTCETCWTVYDNSQEDVYDGNKAVKFESIGDGNFYLSFDKIQLISGRNIYEACCYIKTNKANNVRVGVTYNIRENIETKYSDFHPGATLTEQGEVATWYKLCADIRDVLDIKEAYLHVDTGEADVVYVDGCRFISAEKEYEVFL